LTVEIGSEGRILAVNGDGCGSDLSFLKGLKVGREVRDAKRKRLPRQISESSLVHRILEELAPLAFLGRGALFSWEDREPRSHSTAHTKQSLNRKVEGLCISYQPGSIALTNEGLSNLDVIHQRLGFLATDNDDPWAWHEFGEHDGPHFLRLRRQDVRWEGEDLDIDLAFQDAAKANAEGPLFKIYHEYAVRATIDPDLGRIKAIDTTAGTLPFSSCLSAQSGAELLIGKSPDRIGSQVSKLLGGTAGCTHLNSAFQTLEDAIGLQRHLRGAGELHR